MWWTGIRKYFQRADRTIDNAIPFLSQCQHFEKEMCKIFSRSVKLFGEEVSNRKS